MISAEHVTHNERLLVSAFVANPLLLDDEHVVDFAAIELTQPSTPYLVMSAVRSLEACRTPITADAVRDWLTREFVEKNGHTTGSKHMPDVDELIEMAEVTPPSLASVHQMIEEVRRAAEERRVAKQWADELAKARTDIDALISSSAARQRRPLFCVDAVDLLGMEFGEPQWLVTGLVTRGGTALIGGLPKAVKTWLATEIAVAVATGSKVCGEFFAATGSVAYFYAEDTDRQVRNRVRALLAGAGRTQARGRLHLQPRGEFLDVLNLDDLAWIVASCRQRGRIDLLILDPLRDLHSGEEDKSDSMRDVMRRLRALGTLLGCTVLAVHHMGKPGEQTGRRGGGQRLRGSGAIHGSIDSGIYFLDGNKNGADEWTSEIESEVKGARSAGFFTLGLKLEDDARGEAREARWTFERPDAGKEPRKSKAELMANAKREAAEADDRTAFTFVRELAMRGELLTRDALRRHDECPIPDRRMYSALCRLIEEGRLLLGPQGRVLLHEVPGTDRGQSC